MRLSPWTRAGAARAVLLLLVVCVAAAASVQAMQRTLDAWIEPPPVLGRPSTVTVRAVDRETRAAVRGTVTIYSEGDTTRVATNRPFIHVFRCDTRRLGEVTSTTCEHITVSAAGYKTLVLSYAGNVHPRRP